MKKQDGLLCGLAFVIVLIFPFGSRLQMTLILPCLVALLAMLLFFRESEVAIVLRVLLVFYLLFSIFFLAFYACFICTQPILVSLRFYLSVVQLRR